MRVNYNVLIQRNYISNWWTRLRYIYFYVLNWILVFMRLCTLTHNFMWKSVLANDQKLVTNLMTLMHSKCTAPSSISKQKEEKKIGNDVIGLTCECWLFLIYNSLLSNYPIDATPYRTMQQEDRYLRCLCACVCF